MTEKTPVTESNNDPLDRLVALSTEVRTHRERMVKLFEQLDTKDPQSVGILAQELVDTQMSLFDEFTEAVTDTFNFERAYLEEVVIPGMDEDDDDEEDEEDDDGSILTAEDAAEFTAVLASYRVMLTAALTAPELPEEAKSEMESWLGRVEKAIQLTDDITEEPDDEPEPVTQ